MEPDFASPEEDAGDQHVTFQDAELMNEARFVGEGPSPSFYLDMGQTIVEVVVISSDFAPQGSSEPMTLLALPVKALGRRKGTQAGPLLHRASLTVPVTGPLDALDVGLKVDVGVFTAAVVDSLLGEDELPDPGAVTFSFLDAAGNPVSLLGAPLAEAAETVASGWWTSKLQAAKAKSAPAKAAGYSRPSALKPKSKFTVKPPGPPLLDGAKLVESGVDAASAQAILDALGQGAAHKPLLNAVPPALPAAPLDDGLGVGELEDGEAFGETQELGLAGALLKLTAVLAELQPQKKATGLEAVLGNLAVSAGSSDSAGVSAAGPSRKNAQARLALRGALRDQPMHFASHVEAEASRKVGEIVRSASASSSAGSSGGTVPYRTYVEHRAFVSGHRPTQQWLWILSGIGEALTSGRIEEARARVALGMVYGEQVCLDGGHTPMAAELLFEDAPPVLHSRLPDQGGILWPAIASDVWGEVVLGHLKDRIAWEQHRATALGRRRQAPLLPPSDPSPAAGTGTDEADAHQQGSRRRPRPKAKAKSGVL